MTGSVSGDLFATLLFLGFQLCGMGMAFALLPGETAGARLLFGSVWGSVLLMTLPVPFAFFLGFTMPAQLWALALAALFAALCLLHRGRKEAPLSKAVFRRRVYLLPAAFAVFFVLLVLRSFRFEEGRVFSSQATYGDMNMHLAFITSIARQGAFPPDYPLLSGVRLSYPFLGDSISSALLLCGAGLRWAYGLPMFFAGAQVFFGFLLLAGRILGRARRAQIAFLLFFLNGGLGVLWFLHSPEDFGRIFTAFYETPTNLVGENIRWVNVIADMLLPQRATLFGWAALFSVLTLLYTAVFRHERRYFLYAGVLGGLLPMIHTHSFLALGLAALGWMLGERMQKRGLWVVRGAVVLGPPGMAALQVVLRRTGREDSPLLILFAAAVLLAALMGAVAAGCRRGLRAFLSGWGVFALCALGLALPQLCFWTFRQTGEGFVRGHFGWVVGEDGYLWFYLKNMGLTAVLGVLGLLFCRKRALGRYLPALLIWFPAEFVEFQPNDYDNNKLLYVAYAFLCFAAADFLGSFLVPGGARKLRLLLTGRGGRLSRALSLEEAQFKEASRAFEGSPGGMRRGLFRKLVLSAVLFACGLSALLTLGREWVSRYELYGTGAVALAEYASDALPPDAVVLTDQRHNNEITSLAGCDIVCGSPSYLYFHGLDYYRQERDAARMYRDPERYRALFAEYGVGYVLLSDFERASFAPDEAVFDRLFETVYRDGTWVLYRVPPEWEKEGAS